MRVDRAVEECDAFGVATHACIPREQHRTEHAEGSLEPHRLLARVGPKAGRALVPKRAVDMIDARLVRRIVRAVHVERQHRTPRRTIQRVGTVARALEKPLFAPIVAVREDRGRKVAPKPLEEIDADLVQGCEKEVAIDVVFGRRDVAQPLVKRHEPLGCARARAQREVLRDVERERAILGVTGQQLVRARRVSDPRHRTAVRTVVTLFAVRQRNRKRDRAAMLGRDLT